MTTVTLTEHELIRRSRLTWMALTALFLAAMDATVMGTLIPVIRQTFGQPEAFPWLMSGFILAAVLAMPLSGLLADRLGQKPLILSALLLFMLGSVWVAMASDMTSLIGGRVLQGVGSGGITVLVYTLIGSLYGPDERGKMQGLLSAVWGLAAIAGPVVGASIHTLVDWHWVFWANVPLVLLIMVMGAALMPRDAVKPQGASFDLLGFAGFCALAAGGLLWLMSPAQASGLMPVAVYASSTTVGIVLLALSLIRRQDGAFLAVEFFRERAFIIAMCCILLSAAILYACVTLLPIYMVEALHRSLLDAGGVVLAASLGWVIGATVCGNLIGHIGSRACTQAGFVLLLSGSGLLLVPELNTWLVCLLLAQLLVGLGIGFVATATLILVQNQSRPQRLGQVTAGVQVFRQLGAALGINALGALYLSESASGGNAAQVFQSSFAVMAVCALVGLLLTTLIQAGNREAGL